MAILLGAQTAHKTCILFAVPQEGHLTNSVTSFRALPAICLDLLLACETFFLGTALSRPSHISSSDGSAGRFNEMAGIGQEIFGKRGCDICRMWKEAYREEKLVEAERRGRRAARDGAVRADSIAVAMIVSVNRSGPWIVCTEAPGRW